MRGFSQRSTMPRALPRRPALAKKATTGAAAMTRVALTVSSSGSPGPTPTP